MSGIFGLYHPDGHRPEPEALETLGRALREWAPDGVAVGLAPGAGLGHLRRVLTPEDRQEAQPWTGCQGDRLVFAGRLDNREELLNRLERARPAMADGQLALLAWEAWGEGALDLLVGDFSLAIHGGGALLLARSPIFAPPIFYHATSATLAFAVHPKGLFALPQVPRAIHARKLADMLVSSLADPEATLFQEIRRLPTGTCLLAEPSGLRLRRTWTPALGPDPGLSDQACLEAFRGHLAQAVQARSRSAGGVGILLSGGLDSTSVAAAFLAAKGEARLPAFTAVPSLEVQTRPGWHADDWPLVQALGQQYPRLEPTRVATGERTFLDDLEPLFPLLHRPFLNEANLPWVTAALDAARSQGIQVLLEGGLGNLGFSRNGTDLLRGLVAAGAWRLALDEARRRAPGAPLRTLARAGLLLWPALRAGLDRLRRDDGAALDRSPIRPAFAREQRVLARAREAAAGLAGEGERQACARIFATIDAGAFHSVLLARHGVDLRTPPGDRRLVAFCLALPDTQFLRGGMDRALVRRAMAGAVPASILHSPTRGLQAPDAGACLARIRPRLARELDQLGQHPLVRHVLDLERLRGILATLPGDPLAQRVLQRGVLVGRYLAWFESGA